MAPWPPNINNMRNLSIQDWVKLILNPKDSLGIVDEDVGNFQLYVAILCDMMWMTRNKKRLEAYYFLVLSIEAGVLNLYGS